MNTKIIASLIAISTVAAAAGAATMAYFSDVETSTGNTFAAGTLDLKLDSADLNVVKFTVTDANPGNSGTGTWVLNNPSSLNGFLDIESVSKTDAENGCGSDAEKAADATCDVAGDAGELSSKMDVVLFWDDGNASGIANNRIKDGGEKVIYSGELSAIPASFDEDYSLVKTGTTYISMTWAVDGASVGNEIQGDSATLGLSFDLGQNAD